LEEEKQEQLRKELESNKAIESIKLELEKKNQELKDLKEEMVKKVEIKPFKKIKEKPLAPIIIKKEKPIKPIKLKPEEKFLNEVKELLSKKNIEIINLEKIDKKEAYLRINLNSKQFLLAAFDKKKIDDKDLIKAYKKAQSINLPYIIFSKGDVSKKTREAIDAYRRLAAIEKIEDTIQISKEDSKIEEQ
jgi:hypothetical protein